VARGRGSLFFWVALALAVAAAFPLAIGLWQLSIHRHALLGQVQRLQIFVASSAAHRVAAYVEELRREAVTASRNPLLAEPAARPAQELLADLIQQRPELLAAGILRADGETVVLAQRRDSAATVARALAEAPGDALRLAGEESRWLRVEAAMPAPAGAAASERLVLLAEASRLEEILAEANQIGDAETVLVDRGPRALLGDRELVAQLPPSLLGQVGSEKLAGGAGNYRAAGGEEIIAAHFPVAGTPWLVISRQPRAAADAARLRMRQATLSATVGALFIATMLSILGYRLLVLPIRRLVRAQAEVAGLDGPVRGGSEIAQLESTFARLMLIEQKREILGEIFLGRYKVMGKLGSGGSGTVFNGFDPVLQRPVALKAVPLGKDGDVVAKLQSEAVHLARLNHPNIVTVFDFERRGDTAYIAMEKVDGVSLDQYLRQSGPLAAREGVAIAAAVTAALVAAHGVNLVHGDLKPGNILLDRDGAIKVADFGTARVVRRDAEAGDRLIGTAGYVAPEVLHRKGATRASDLFSLGVVMYQIFTGRRPFGEGKLSDILRRTLEDEPEDLAAARSMLPGDLTRLVKRLLSKDPQGRPGSAAAVAAELERVRAELGDEWKLDVENILLGETRRRTEVATEFVTAVLGEAP